LARPDSPLREAAESGNCTNTRSSRDSTTVQYLHAASRVKPKSLSTDREYLLLRRDLLK